MTKAQHTPGPWYVGIDDEPTSNVPAIEIDSGEEMTKSWKSIAYVNSTLKGANFRITEIDRASAHLIAAAPCLLGALSDALATEYDRDEESRNFDEEKLEQWAAIIAKAQGKS